MSYYPPPQAGSTYTRTPTIVPDLYEISGDVRTGLHAEVTYLCAWADAVQMAYNALRSPTATHIGGIQWFAPFQLPLLINGVQPPLYANAIKVKPKGCGASPGSTYGINPPEYFTDAHVTISFDNVAYLQGETDDPSGLSQLDPTNPITACEQSAKIIGNIETRKGAAFTYQSGTFSGKAVPGEVGVNRNQVKLSLRFPRVPYLPWTLVEPYVGKTNSTTILGCNTGSLLLEGLDTDVTPSLIGFNQKVALQFAFKPDWTGSSPGGLDWNNEEMPDGSGEAPIAGAGGITRYQKVNFATMFVGLEF